MPTSSGARPRVLQVAEEVGAESLALPTFGTGVSGLPVDECARIMVEWTPGSTTRRR